MGIFDRSEFVSKFVEEARENLEALNRGVVELEKRPGDGELLTGLMRAAHTLKGSSRMLKFAEVNQVAHRTEDVLEAVRDGQLAMAPEVGDALFMALDEIGACLEEIADGGDGDRDVVGMCRALEELIEGRGGPAATASAAAVEAAPTEEPEPAEEPAAAPAEEPAATTPAEKPGPEAPPETEEGPAAQASAADAAPPLEFDASQFLGSFVQEARENLAALNRGMVELEKRPGDAELLTELMRAAHTLKGTSRMVNVLDVNQVAHRAEDVLEAVRDGQVAMSPEVGDALFMALDEIGACVEAVAAGGGGERDVAGSCRMLEEFLGSESPVPESPVPETQLPEPREPEAPPPATPSPGDAAAAATRVAGELDAPPVRTAAAAGAQASGSGGDGASVGGTRDDAAPAAAPARAEETLRIGLAGLDQVIRLAGEIRISGMRLDHTFGQLAEMRRTFRRFQAEVERCAQRRPGADGAEPACAGVGEIFAGLDDLYRGYREDLAGLERMAAELQEKSLEMRMLPLSTLFEILPRAVRDLSRAVGKEVELVVEGAETRLDKKIIEQLDGPVVHMVRNCIDHGIEDPEVRAAAGKPRVGTLRIAASQEGDHIAIVVEDDGGGIDLEAVRRKALQKELVDGEQLEAMSDREAAELIFLPGFSTAAIITDLSGRGVGMDVVRSAIEGLKGSVSVETERGVGTRLAVQLPMTLTTTRAMMVECGGRSFSVPIGYVTEVVEVEASAITQVVDREAIALRDQMIPIAELSQVLGLEARPAAADRHPSVLIVRAGADQIALTVDSIVDEQDILLKPLPPHLGETPCVSGVCIFGDSQISVVLHAPGLVDAMRAMGGTAATPAERDETGAGRRILVVDDSLNTREIEKSILEAHGYEVELARDGVEGLAMALERSYDMVVTDLDMPRLDGFALVERLRAEPECAHTPIVIVTSREKDEDRRRGIEVGADAYISKGGFDQSKLIDTIGSLIG